MAPDQRPHSPHSDPGMIHSRVGSTSDQVPPCDDRFAYKTRRRDQRRKPVFPKSGGPSILVYVKDDPRKNSNRNANLQYPPYHMFPVIPPLPHNPATLDPATLSYLNANLLMMPPLPTLPAHLQLPHPFPFRRQRHSSTPNLQSYNTATLFAQQPPITTATQQPPRLNSQTAAQNTGVLPRADQFVTTTNSFIPMTTLPGNLATRVHSQPRYSEPGKTQSGQQYTATSGTPLLSNVMYPGYPNAPYFSLHTSPLSVYQADQIKTEPGSYNTTSTSPNQLSTPPGAGVTGGTGAPINYSPVVSAAPLSYSTPQQQLNFKSARVDTSTQSSPHMGFPSSPQTFSTSPHTATGYPYTSPPYNPELTSTPYQQQQQPYKCNCEECQISPTGTESSTDTKDSGYSADEKSFSALRDDSSHGDMSAVLSNGAERPLLFCDENTPTFCLDSASLTNVLEMARRENKAVNEPVFDNEKRQIRKQIPCRNLSQGGCRFGEDCWFSHNIYNGSM